MIQVRSQARGRWLAAVLLVTATLIGGTLWHSGGVAQDARPLDSPAIRQAENLSAAFRQASEAVLPTVVKISTRTRARQVQDRGNRGNGSNPFRGTPFEDFFDNDNSGREGPFGLPFTPPQQGLGSGVIIDRSGVILTNNHVVANPQGVVESDVVEVEFSDGRVVQVDPENIKTDPQTDLAVIVLKGAGTLPAAALGDSDALRIGDWVIAIGNPFDYEATVSAGIISGKGRDVGAASRAKYLQTDAAINPGNSGGPLVNLRGEVVGINSAIASRSGSFSGIGFAVPVNLAKWVAGQLIDSGEVHRAYLGVSIAELTPELAGQFDVPSDSKGVLVQQVYDGTPAAAADLREGDIVTHFNSTPVATPRELQSAVERAPVGSRQNITVLRDGRRTQLDVDLEALPDDFGVASRQRRRRAPNGASGYTDEKLGLEVSELTRDVAEQLGYDAGTQGVLVTSVEVDGIAFDKGIREGMVIMQIARRPVRSVDDYQQLMKGQSLDRGVLMLVRSQGGNLFIVLRQ